MVLTWKDAEDGLPWGVLLLWWTGLLPMASIRPEDLAGSLDGVDYGRILVQIVDAAYWPVTLFAAARVVFDLLRAASGGNARLTAVGDISFGAAAAWGLSWLWFWSPLSPVIWVGTAIDFFDRVRSLFDRTGDHGGELATLLMIIVVWAFVGEVWRVLRGVGRMIVGRC